jgi:hypothetical protein
MHNFIYSIIILHHDPQHVLNIAVLIFRRTIVYLQYLVSSHSVCCHPVHRLRADCSPMFETFWGLLVYSLVTILTYKCLRNSLSFRFGPGVQRTMAIVQGTMAIFFWAQKILFFSFYISSFLSILNFLPLFVSLYISLCFLYFLFYVSLSLFLPLFLFLAFYRSYIAKQWLARHLIRMTPGSNMALRQNMLRRFVVFRSTTSFYHNPF